MSNSKGFTLIELLVVIAIIGILAGILFVAINPKAQTDKANNAKSKSELASIRTQAAIVFSSESLPETGYDNVCTNNAVTALVGGLTNGVCGDSATAWAAAGDLTDGTQWCVDSTGFTGASTTDLTNSDTACTHA